MACPKCGCKETYPYVEDDLLGPYPYVEDDLLGLPDDQERCAACGEIFYFEEHAPEDEDDAEMAEWTDDE